jgi:uncharacterized protein (TIGR03435 family)
MRILAFALLSVAAAAQTDQPARVEFEAASIKPGDPTSPGMSMQTTPGGLEMHNTNLRNLVLNAFHLNQYQLAGGPKWMDTAKFDVVARYPAGGSHGRQGEMMQTLLKDRFQLEFHRETRTVPAFALVVASGGHHLQEASEDDKQKGHASSGPRKMEGFAMPMSSLVSMLMGPAGAPVVDRTGLTGQYNFTVEYSPEGTPPELEKFPPFLVAVQQQLGLKLEAIKTPLEILVIDRAEKPSEN